MDIYGPIPIWDYIRESYGRWSIEYSIKFKSLFSLSNENPLSQVISYGVNDTLRHRERFLSQLELIGYSHINLCNTIEGDKNFQV